MQQHPFSIASACNSRSISLTAKAAGDFTARWKDLKPGTKAFLEGPFGSFTPKPEKKIFMVMGGIGITPGMSMLRTLAEEKSQKEVILIYANPDWENVTFREELDELQGVINLKLIHLLEKPPENWKGESGLISKDLLKKYLPENKEDFAFYICGPKPLMNISELAFRDLGVDWRMVYSERFHII